jgi:long-subunit fatty acid transport protein
MRRLAAKVFLIFLLAAGTAFSQDFHLYGFSMYNLEFLGSGARARSLGGAFVGVADDASALTWNPAGLIQISKTQASVSGSVVRLKTENDIKYASYSSRNFDRDYTKDLLNLAAGSFVAPVRIKGHPFVAAANYQRVIDDNDDFWDRSDISYDIVAASFVLRGVSAPEENNTESIRNLHRFALGFGTDIYDKFSIGGAVNIYYGNGASQYKSLVQDTLPVSGGVQVYDTAAVYWIQNTRDAQSYSGVGLMGSIMYRTDKFRLGASISAPHELVTEHDIKRADTLYIKSVRVPGRGTPATTPRPTLYLGKTKIEVPLTFGLGASVQVTPKFLLSGDVELRSTGSTKYFVRSEEPPATSADSLNLFTLPSSIYYNDTTETSYYDASGKLVEIFNEFELGYESSMQVRLGAEYMLPTKYGTIPLRGGIRITQLPYRDASGIERDAYQQVMEGFVLGDKISRKSYSFGSGIHWNQIWLDGVVEMNKEEQTQTGVSFYEGLQFNYETTRTKTVPSFMLTFTGFF